MERMRPRRRSAPTLSGMVARAHACGTKRRKVRNTNMLHTAKKLARKRKGFTLIELLIVILVLAILRGVALPLYLAAVADAQVKPCRSNMQTIANAEAAYKTKDPAHSYTTTLTNLNGDLGATPV